MAMKMVIVVEFPELEEQDAMDLDPHEPAESMLSLWEDEHRVGNLANQCMLVGAEWDGSASLSAMLHLEGIR